MTGDPIFDAVVQGAVSVLEKRRQLRKRDYQRRMAHYNKIPHAEEAMFTRADSVYADAIQELKEMRP